MELIAKSLISILGIGALCLVIYVQRDSLTAAKVRAEAAEQITRDRDGTIKTLTDAAARDKKAAAKLQAARDSIADTLIERENLIERLQHDDPAIRTWADTPLPGAVARLREHPTVTGADAYSQRLPSDHALPVAGSGAQD
jgi:LysB family phage lysis regulatory protein